MTTTTSMLPVDFIDIRDHHDAVDRLKLLNRGSGFVITIERTKQDRNALKQTRKVYLRCWKSRPYKSVSTGARKSSTRSTECPWRACLTRQDGGWSVEVKNNEHNHELDAASPVPQVSRRQNPKPPLRALAAMTPSYPMQAALTPQSVPSRGIAFAPQTFANLPQATPYTPPMQFPGFPQFPGSAPPPAVTGPNYRSTTPTGTPPIGASQYLPDAERPAVQATPGNPTPASGSRRYRRGGYSVMSEIKRIQVPMDSRLVSTPRNQFRPEAPAFLIYHKDFDNILGENPNIEIIYEDKVNFAHGAGIFSPHRDIVFMTSVPQVPAGKLERAAMVSKLTRKPDGSWRRDEALTVAVLLSGGTNYGDGLLFCSQGDYRDFGGLVYMEADYPHRTTPLLNNYLGRRFNSLNDVVVHSDGSIWFTDPIYGFEQGLRPKPELPNQVYRFDPQTGDVRVVADGFGRPKGICFSPYEKIVYISDTDSFHGDGSIDPTRPSTIYAFDVLEKRNTKWLTNRRVFAMPDTGIPDGIKCDMAGNVYVGCGDGVNIWSRGGVLLGKILIPGGITNFCFGRDGELFLLNGTRFWGVTVSDTVKGAVLGRMGLQPDGPEREGSDDSMTSLFGGE